MPIYEYKCSDCGANFDALRAMKEADSKIACKKCLSENTHRVLSTCFAHGVSQPSSSGGGCSGCSGGSCSSCRN